ncbi:MAG: SdrD B-like domain-containing protein [Bacteroidota bacterium]
MRNAFYLLLSSLVLSLWIIPPLAGQVNPNVITFEPAAVISFPPVNPGSCTTSFSPTEGDTVDATLNDFFDCYYGVRFFLEDEFDVRTEMSHIAEVGDQGYDNDGDGASDGFAFSRGGNATTPECSVPASRWDMPDPQGPLGSSGEELGCYFLTDEPGINANPKSLIIQYSITTSQTSGYLMDIDASEAWTLTAYDAMNNIIGGPITVCNSGCDIIAPGTPQEGIATYWSFNTSVPIAEVELRYSGPNPDSPVGLGFDNFSASQLQEEEPGCADESCLTSVLDISTGVDHSTGSLYPIGAGDAYWTLLSVPGNAGNISVPRPAFVIPSEPIVFGGQQFFNVWAEPTTSGWISGQPINNWTVNGGPYVMERCFCICEPGKYNIDLEVWVDDDVDIGLYQNGVLISSIQSANGFAFGQPGTNIVFNEFLEEGEYCLRADLFNSGSTAMGLNITGTVTGANMLTSSCCGGNSSIVGVKYNDVNCNGFQDGNEPGLANWQIELTAPGQAPIIATTDQDGYYAFVDIEPGTYTVSEVLQPGWTPSLPTGGSYPNAVVNEAQVLILDFGNCEGESCVTSENLVMTKSPSTILEDGSCCWSMNFDNLGQEVVYGIQLNLLNGVEFAPGYQFAPGYFAPNFSNTSLTITSNPLSNGPLAMSIPGMIDFCLQNVNGIPQFMEVIYLSEDYVTPICVDTILFDCGVQEDCLEYLSDELECDSVGYKYTVDFEVPDGNDFDIGYIKMNLDPGLPAGATITPIGAFADPGASGHVFPTPLLPGDIVSLMYLIDTPIDLYGDSLCVIITAHDDTDERQCCFAYENCLPFPLCDPCPFVDIGINPIGEDTTGYCCFELEYSNMLPEDFNDMTGIKATILTEGVIYSGLVTLPALLDGWTPVYDDPDDPTMITWTHNSGSVPDSVDYELFEFCVEGTTSTDSIYIETSWLQGDSMLCMDTIGIYCPDCLSVPEDEFFCDPNDPTSYTYLFNFTNHSPFDVNAVGILDIDSPPGAVTPMVHYLGTTVPPGGTYTGFIPVELSGMAGDSICFDVVLRQIIGEEINIICCYATHCVVLPECENPLNCPDPELATQQQCEKVFLPVCGCDGQTYANACYAQNAGVFDYDNGPCGPVFEPDPRIDLTGTLAPGGVDLQWELTQPGDFYDFYAVRGRWPFEQDYKLVDEVDGTDLTIYNLFHPNNMPGLNTYQTLGVLPTGLIVASNELEIFLAEEDNQPLVQAFPSPARDELNVTTNRNGPGVIELLSPDGQRVITRQANFNGTPIPVNVGHLRDGVFILRVRFDNGEVAQQRVVKLR